ncbi:MAG TPA: RNA polymerase sigma factor [Polyangiales bacterium]|nr:RNA polymerase sigma factor [Polyangiales bacterium]
MFDAFDGVSHSTRESTVRKLLTNHHDALLARARHFMKSEADAWDLLQDTLERALKQGPPPSLPEDKLRAWLMVVMRNLHTDYRRAARRRRWVPLHECDVPSRSEPPAAEPVWGSIEPAEVEACVQLLEPTFREAYQLRTLHGLSLAEIAVRMQVSTVTAGTRVFRARQRLRELLSHVAHHRAIGLLAPVGAVPYCQCCSSSGSAGVDPRARPGCRSVRHT